MNTPRLLRVVPALCATLLLLTACATTSGTPGGGYSSSSASSEPQASAAAGCAIGGCSGEVCSDVSSDPIVSACIYKEEFACYKTARCEKQAGGTCGWTRTDALMTCLANAKTEQ